MDMPAITTSMQADLQLSEETPLESPVWPELTTGQTLLLWLWPSLTLAAIIVFFYLWKPREEKPKFKLPSAVTNYGAIPTVDSPHLEAQTPASPASSDGSDVLHPGDVAGAYYGDWRDTFEYYFVWIMLGFFLVLMILTTWLKPELFFNGQFWLYQAPKVLAMMSVSLLGGAICRHFCAVDERGYIVTTKNSAFKVNYTRKLQHFAAYLIPLIIRPGPECGCSGALELAWGDFFTLLTFLFMIRPVRERYTFFMLQFNSLDRPEDRPHTLKWIIGGNIIPGLLLILFFRGLFSYTGQENLVFIIICITGIGDGLAEPVGVTFGRHKYIVRSCFSARPYTRSYEGSACVFMSGMLFPALQYQDFRDPAQCWLAMLLLPPAMAYAEATSPHTMDTPALMVISGLILFTIERLF